MADVIEVIANAVLGALFLWAGVAKLLDGPVWMRQAADMGVPWPIAMPVPYVELAVGLLLVSQLFSPWSAIVAAVMLMAFTAVIALRLRDGSRPPCACFGSWSKRPLGAVHILRNLCVLAVAGSGHRCRGSEAPDRTFCRICVPLVRSKVTVRGRARVALVASVG